jgi:hypothetical protein
MLRQAVMQHHIRNQNSREGLDIILSRNGFILSLNAPQYCTSMQGVGLLFIGDFRVCRRHQRHSRTLRPLGRTMTHGPILDLQHVIPNAVSKGVRITLGVLEAS